MAMTRDVNDAANPKPPLVKGKGQGRAASHPAAEEGLPADGVWGDLLQASPWSNRPFRGLRNAPMLPFAEAEMTKSPPIGAEIWDPGWSGDDAGKEADRPSAGLDVLTDIDAAPGTVIDVEVEVEVAPPSPAPEAPAVTVVAEEEEVAVAPPAPAPEAPAATVVAEEIVAAKPAPPPPVAAAEVAKPVVAAPAAKKVEVKKTAPAPQAGPGAGKTHEVPVENLLTGVVTLVGSGVGSVVGLAAFAGASAASALGFGAKKQKHSPGKAKK
nr:uncharacterized protein [uncultured bacterium]